MLSTSSPSPGPDWPVVAVEARAPSSPRSRVADRALALPRGLLVLLSVAGVVVAVAGLRSASSIVGPAFLALMIVITIHPLLAWLQRHRVPSWLAVALTMLVVYASQVALAAALVVSAARLATLLPSYQAQFTSLIDQFTERLGELGVTQDQINSVISQFDLGSLVGVVQPVLSGANSVVSDLVFILALLFFLILDSSSFVIQSLVLPKFVGDAVGLSVTLTFLSLVYWTFVIGPLGALLAVPLSLFVKALLVDADPDSRWLDRLIAPVEQGDGDGPGSEGGGDAGGPGGWGHDRR
jgi:predicted PurR-regulated permease PerM